MSERRVNVLTEDGTPDLNPQIKGQSLNEDLSSNINGILLTVARSFQRVALVTILDLTPEWRK